MPPSLPASFRSKKQKILATLAVPETHYQDLSPKGCVDDGIRDLIAQINTMPGCVTTSSCAGRISVYLEGRKRDNVDVDAANGNANVDANLPASAVTRRQTSSSIGGKGGGGRWLFVSHDAVVLEAGKTYTQALGMQRYSATQTRSSSDASGRFSIPFEHDSTRLIHFKFEPMILHILTASLAQAQVLLTAAIQAGFRESGALNLLGGERDSATPMVGIRSMGLALESIVGVGTDVQETCMVDEWYLQGLLAQANRRFSDNANRIKRLQTLLTEIVNKSEIKDQRDWEDPEERRQRKRKEGLERAKMSRSSRSVDSEPEIGFLELV